MSFNTFVVRNKDDPFIIRRRMSEPITIFIGGSKLNLFGTIRFHPPDFHLSGSYRIEIYALSIRRIFRTIIKAGCRGQTFLFTAGRCDRINIIFSISFSTVSKSFIIWRNTMPVRWTLCRDKARFTTRDWYNINK